MMMKMLSQEEDDDGDIILLGRIRRHALEKWEGEREGKREGRLEWEGEWGGKRESGKEEGEDREGDGERDDVRSGFVDVQARVQELHTMSTDLKHTGSGREEGGVCWRRWSWWGGAPGQDRPDVSRTSFWRGWCGEGGVGGRGEA
jgi:hypothetical protein